MGVSTVSKNYLLGAKISFLIMSFIIFVIAITVQNDIWPFLQTTLPSKNNNHVSFILAFIFGIALPGVWLLKDWNNIAIRYSLVSLISMQLIQIITEITVAHYFFASMVIPTSILYVGYRIIQLFNLQRVLYKTNYISKRAKLLRVALVVTNLLFWGVIWIKLTFIIFPQIIYQIF